MTDEDVARRVAQMMLLKETDKETRVTLIEVIRRLINHVWTR